MSKCKGLVELFESMNGLFPGVLREVLKGVKDPLKAKTSKEAAQMVNHNICVLRRRLDVLTNSNPTICADVTAFMSNSQFFSSEERKQIQRFEMDLSRFQESIQQKIQEKTAPVYQEQEVPSLQKRVKKTKKAARRRSDWLQA
ncbi:hypothetical protein [Candidatus Similichlamydia laticola]|uniref:Uncharacterized protein n=1 Tax=Candidatus Similichlamydia laticola TaxID=2170265 RepID=A0A369KBN8_9BACT|nr:hypothetical protein [Candidatus Similichlamydia laticola]RDB31328.1 hypothetical protein HAT2_00568 [Candidatus Similichlamydia laticola]